MKNIISEALWLLYTIKQRNSLFCFVKTWKFQVITLYLAFCLSLFGRYKEQQNSPFVLGCETLSQALKPARERNVRVALQQNTWPLVKTLFIHLFSTPAFSCTQGCGGWGWRGGGHSLWQSLWKDTASPWTTWQFFAALSRLCSLITEKRKNKKSHKLPFKLRDNMEFPFGLTCMLTRTMGRKMEDSDTARTCRLQESGSN